MNRKYTMDVASVRARVKWIRTVEANNGYPNEDLRMAIGDLFGDILQAIADNSCAEPQECAKAALEWRKI